MSDENRSRVRYGEAFWRAHHKATDFLATSDGLALMEAFRQIKNAKLRRRIVDLVEGIADQ